MGTLIIDVIRTLMSWIDKMIYTFLEFLISTFDALTKVELFNSGYLEKMADRLFFLVAIIMIFKVSFSIIQYIINPDGFSNSEKGMGKIVQSVVLVLVGLVIVRPAFDISLEIQKKIMNENIIHSLVLGISSRLDDTSQADLKSKMPFSILKSFVTPNYTQLAGVGRTDNGIYTCNGPMYDESGKYSSAFGECLARLSQNKTYNYSSSAAGNMQGTFLDVYNTAHTYNKYDLLLDLVNEKSKDNADVYVLKYDMLISTAVGVFMVILFLNFCLDLAIRAAKFGFLQLIAPVPIVSMVDPKSSKNGMMSKWLSNCVSTYIGLFLRIAAVDFSILIVDIASNEPIIAGQSKNADSLIQVIIIIGAFLFAKELPKLISDLTGINFKGDFKMNPLERVPGGKAATKTALGTGAAIGTVAGAGAASLGVGAVGALAAPLHMIPAVGNKYGSAGMQLRRTANRMGSTFLSGASRAGNTFLESLPVKVPKGGGNNDKYKEFDKTYEEQLSRNRGQKLAEKIEANGGDKYSIYSNKSFADAVRSMDNAKTNMYATENHYEDLVRRSQNGENITAETINEAKKTAFTAKTGYENLKSNVERLGQRYGTDYRRYNDFKAYDDYQKAMEVATGSALNSSPGSVSPANRNNSSVNSSYSAVTRRINNNSGSQRTYSSEPVNNWSDSENGVIVDSVDLSDSANNSIYTHSFVVNSDNNESGNNNSQNNNNSSNNSNNQS